MSVPNSLDPTKGSIHFLTGLLFFGFVYFANFGVSKHDNQPTKKSIYWVQN